MKTEYKKKFADNWFNYLQSQICKEFEKLEKMSSGKQNKFVLGGQVIAIDISSSKQAVDKS